MHEITSEEICYVLPSQRVLLSLMAYPSEHEHVNKGTLLAQVAIPSGSHTR